jgi:hypothetical protein
MVISSLLTVTGLVIGMMKFGPLRCEDKYAGEILKKVF